jgi:putative oxidoreductase
MVTSGEDNMSIKQAFAVPQQSCIASCALLGMRIVAGLAFVYHGWGKIQSEGGMFGWMGDQGFAPPPLQGIAAFAEFGGGMAWILGLLTPLASLGIVSTMGVAVYMHAVMQGAPFVSMRPPSYELALVYLSIAAVLMTAGPGKLSADRVLFGPR